MMTRGSHQFIPDSPYIYQTDTNNHRWLILYDIPIERQIESISLAYILVVLSTFRNCITNTHGLVLLLASSLAHAYQAL